MSGKVVWRGQDFLNQMVRAVEKGTRDAVDEAVALCQARAPRRKVEGRKETYGYRGRRRQPQPTFATDVRRSPLAPQSSLMVHRIGQTSMPRAMNVKTRKPAQPGTFTIQGITSGRNMSVELSPQTRAGRRERAAAARGDVTLHFTASRGLRVSMGGGLARSIHGYVKTNGLIVKGTIRAEAPYALYVHEGFTHTGGKHIAGRPWMRGVVEGQIGPAYKAGKYFVKG